MTINATISCTYSNEDNALLVEVIDQYADNPGIVREQHELIWGQCCTVTLHATSHVRLTDVKKDRSIMGLPPIVPQSGAPAHAVAVH